MRFNKKAFTLLELQMGGLIMIVVLIATGCIFYFALASMRYLHDAVVVYVNASAAMKTLTDEIMVSNTWGNAQGMADEASPSFFSFDGYVHGTEGESTVAPGGRGLSNASAGSVNAFMPVPGNGSDAIFLRQPPQGGASVGGDFPTHDNVAIFRDTIAVTGEEHLFMDVQNGGGFNDTNPDLGKSVARLITEFSFWEIGYNCVGVRITATGTVQDPLGNDVYQVTLGKMITLRCAPNRRPWLN